ncbi:MAG TPA: hypothetical protein VFZ53_04235, partial [Polyangiaceae bacterium]
MAGFLRLPWWCALIVSLAGRVAWAAEPTPATGSGVATVPLVVRVESLSPVIGETEFLAALFRTLGRPLVAATGGTPSGDAELTIRYDAAQRELV